MRRGRSKCSKFVTRRSSACSSDCSCSIWGNYPIEGQSLVTWLDILPSLLHFPNPLTSSVPLITFSHPSSCTGPQLYFSPHPWWLGSATDPPSLSPPLLTVWKSPQSRLRSSLSAIRRAVRRRARNKTATNSWVEYSTPAHPSPCHTTAQTTDAPTNAPASKDDFFQNKP